MLNEWFKLLLAGIAILAVVLVAPRVKVPGSLLIGSVTDPAITDSVPAEPAPVEPEPAPTDSAPTDATSTEPILTEPPPAEPVLAEPTPAEPTGASIFQDILQIFQTPTPPVTNPVSITPKGVSRLKIFVLAQDALESAVNEWLAVQQGIAVDQLNVQDYGGGGYLIVISYHTGGTGNSPTRLKIVEGENSEADAQAFLSSLGASQTVRSVAAVAGSYSMPEKTITVPIIFIVYE